MEEKTLLQHERSKPYFLLNHGKIKNTILCRYYDLISLNGKPRVWINKYKMKYKYYLYTYTYAYIGFEIFLLL